MNIDLIVFPLIIVLSLLLGQNNTPKNRKTFIILVSIILLLKASLRDLSVGSDTESYFHNYQNVISTPWKDILLSFTERYSTLSGDYDYGYTILQKLISLFTRDFHVFTFIAQLLFYVPFGILLYRFCSDFHQLTFAFVLYNALFMGLPMANARQFYSIGLAIMAYLCLYEKKYIQCAIWLIVGYFIHQTCMLALLPIGLRLISTKMIKRGTLVTFVLFPIVLVFSNQVIYAMGGFVESERYMNYGTGALQGGAWTYIISTLLMCLFCYIAIKNHHLSSSPKLNVLYVMLPLTIFFSPLIYSNGSMIRIVMYYQIYFVVLFPYALDCFFAKQYRTTVYIVSILLLIFMSVRATGAYYYFFWQQPQYVY